MSRIPKGAMFGIAVSGVVLALLALSLLLMNGGGQSTQAQGGTGADPNIIGIDVKIDDDGDTTPDNTQSTLGVIDNCIEVPASAPDGKVNDGCPAVGPAESGAQCDNNTDDDADGKVNDGCPMVCAAESGAQCDNNTDDDLNCFSVDVFLDDIPTGQDFSTQDYFLSFDPTKLTAVSQNHSASLILLALDPQSNLFDASPAPSATAFHSAILDVYIPAADAAEQPGDLGVLGRYTLHAIGTGLTSLNLSDNTLILGNSIGEDWAAIDIDQVWDNNFVTPYGLVAIDTSCPVLGDVDIESQELVDKSPDDPATGVCQATPPLTDIDILTHDWICLKKTIVNNGSDPVDVDVYKFASIPASPTGGEVSYHCSDAEEVIVDGGAPVACTPGNVYYGSDILVHELVAGVVPDPSVELTPEQWDVYCTQPSTHVFTFKNLIVPVGITDPDVLMACDPADPATWSAVNCGANYAQSQDSVNCWAESDFGITNPAVDAPTSAGQGATFDVVVSADINNNGPYGPTTAEATFDLTLAGSSTATCNLVPVGSQTVTGITLGNGGSTSRDATWQVTCTTTGTADFDGDISVALAAGQPHIEDLNGANDSDSASDSTDITASADARIIDWVFPDDMAPPAASGAAETGDQCENAVDDDGDTVVNDGCPDIAGNQLLVDPGVAEDLDTTETLDNNPANTTYTDTSIDVDVDIDVTVTSGTCTATPDPLSTSTQLLLDGTDEVLLETWSANLTSGDSCSIDFAKDVTITTSGVGEFYGTDNSLTISADLVADTDGDTVPDNYAGIVDNCPDDSNPDQSDVDDDDIGDVCDADNDNDGICDPGKSAAYCTGSDNCPLIPNAGQEDEDADTIGDVCELDVDCSGGQTDISDAWMIGQYILGRANFSLACPPPAGTINGPRASAYVAYPGGGTITDVVMVLQCVLGEVNNLVCPGAPSR